MKKTRDDLRELAMKDPIVAVGLSFLGVSNGTLSYEEALHGIIFALHEKCVILEGQVLDKAMHETKPMLIVKEINHD